MTIAKLRVLLDYSSVENYSKLIAIDLRKQQKLDADPKPIHQIDFTENLEEDNATKFFTILMMKVIFHINFYYLIN